MNDTPTTSVITCFHIKKIGGAADISEITRPYNEIDDYIAAFSDEERQEYVAAETALDLACILYQIRQEQGSDH